MTTATERTKTDWRPLFVAFFVVIRLSVLDSGLIAQANVTDADLEAASGGRTVAVRALGGGRVAAVPLEVYVARVLAGEGEPRAGTAAYEALAVAIRTFAMANRGRHGRDGFDLCDSTHCQVPRAATAVTRQAALATAGQILLYDGKAAELFYSASCGGHSESAALVWPGADFPYLASAPDEVHDADEPWVLEVTLQEVQRALRRAGFTGGRLRDVQVESRSASGRAMRVAVLGLRPEVIAGTELRAAMGANVLRSTAFSIERRGSRLRFTGRGFGHGVGLCVIGAGRRAHRGDDVRTILSQYFPGLDLTYLDGAVTAPLAARAGPSPATRPTAPPPARGPVVVEVPRVSLISKVNLEQVVAQAHAELSTTLGSSVAPITVRLHETMEDFRSATGRPWWVNAVAAGSSIDLAPAAVLAQRDGLDVAVRIAVADLLVAGPLQGRPLWVRVGAARHFGRRQPGNPPGTGNGRCPTDAELTHAISATAHREGEARAEACFAREYAKSGDWRAVRSRD